MRDKVLSKTRLPFKNFGAVLTFEVNFSLDGLHSIVKSMKIKTNILSIKLSSRTWVYFPDVLQTYNLSGISLAQGYAGRGQYVELSATC